VPRIPGPPLWQLPRVAIEGARRPHLVSQELYETYGLVVRMGFWPVAYTYLFGREANELILSQRPDEFTWREALRALETVDGPTALVLTDGPEHKRRRRLVQPAFATRRIDAAVPVVVEEVDRAIDAFAPGGRVDIYTEYRKVVRRIVTRVLFGAGLAGQADRLGDALEPAMHFVDRPPQFQFRGAPGYRAATRARREADAIVDAEMARRRASGDLGDDVLGVLLETELTDEERRDQVVSLIAAGYETTSAAVGWTVLELLRSPGVLEAATAEVDERVGDRVPDADDLRAMPYVAAVVNESLRLHPPGVLSGRRASSAFEYMGHTIPEGSIVLFSPYVTQRMPEYWGDDADVFRPERWLEQEPAPFTFIPFGGAYRKCIGFALALTEVQVTVVRLLQRTRLRIVDPDRTVRGEGLSSTRPEGGVPIIVEERQDLTTRQ
jgi:cytochrome P450